MVVMQTLADIVQAVLIEVLDVVKLGELAAVVGRDELLELLERLAPEVAAVHQEQHALRAGELDEPVDRNCTAVKVLPLPVAIWIRARGRSWRATSPDCGSPRSGQAAAPQ